MSARLPVAVLLAVVATGCSPASKGPASWFSGRVSPTAPAEPDPRIPPVPAGARLVSFDAERESASAGALLEPAWCVQLAARVCGSDGRPLAGAPVLFALDRRTGCGRILSAALADEWVLTDAGGAARTILVSSDRPERCHVWASCGAMALGAEVRFEHGQPRDLTIGPALPHAAGPGFGAAVPPPANPDAQVARLLQSFGHGGPEAARAGAEIAAMGRAAIPELLRAVYDEGHGPGRRELAARALALVRDELVLGDLLAALDDGRAAVRSGAESALLERGPARAGGGVRTAAASAGRFGRASALRVLSGWGRAEDVAALAAAAAGDADPLVRATAAWRLRPFADRREAFAALAGALGDRSGFVRFTAAKALGLLPPPAAGAAAAEGLRALADRDPAIRAAGARAARAPEHAGRLLELVADSDERVRRAAVEGLGALAPARPELLERLERLGDDGDRDVRELADRALVASGGRAQSVRMLRALTGGDPAARRAALASLERIYRVEFGHIGFGGEPAERLFVDWTRWVRDCWHLSEREMLERATRAAGSRLRGEALLALVAGARPATARPALKEMAAELAGDEDPAVRAPAAAAWGLLGDGRGRELVLECLASPEWPARFAGCRAAAHLPAADVAGALAGLLGDESSAIRAEAHRALCLLAGRDLGFDPEGPAEARAAGQLKWLEWAKGGGNPHREGERR